MSCHILPLRSMSNYQNYKQILRRMTANCKDLHNEGKFKTLEYDCEESNLRFREESRTKLLDTSERLILAIFGGLVKPKDLVSGNFQAILRAWALSRAHFHIVKGTQGLNFGTELDSGDLQGGRCPDDASFWI